MKSEEARLEARHPIRVVARRTGLKADLIRAWERRYEAISPERSAGRHRFYSDADIDRLLLLREATSSGRTIGQVAHLPDDQLGSLVEEDRRAEAERQAEEQREEARRAAEAAPAPTVPITPPTASPAPPPIATRLEPSRPSAREPLAAPPSAETPQAPPGLDPYLDAIHRLDGRALRHLLERAAMERGYARVLTDVVSPLMRLVGDLWHEERLREMHEHLASFEIRAFVEGLVRRAPADPRAPRLLVTTPRGQRHEVGALLVAATASFEGWDVAYLGSDLSASDIVAAARTLQVLAVALSLAYPEDDPMLGPELLAVRRQLHRDVPVLVGGRAVRGYAEYLRPAPEMAQALHVDDLGELKTLLTQLRLRAGRAASDPQGRAEPATGVALTEPWTVAPSALASPSPGATDLPTRRRPLGHRELPIARAAYERFELDPAVLTENGQLRLGDLQSVRRLAHRLEQAPAAREGGPESSLRAGRLHALGLIHEVTWEMLRRYKAGRNPGVLRRAVSTLRSEIGETELSRTLERFVELFPGTTKAWIDPDAETPFDEEDALERLLVVWVTNRNPAAAPLRRLFDDRELAESSAYPLVVDALERFFAGETPFTDEGETLLDQLAAAQKIAPDSLAGQLEHLLGQPLELPRQLSDRLWMALDVIREEEAPPFDEAAGPPPQQVLDLGVDSTDADAALWRRRDEPGWMRELVLVAKNVKVWLAQLSKTHGRAIERLDEIPDEALDALVEQGFTGLWLIGIWKRSRASQQIKKRAGRADALASAYAIDEYEVAEDLGGEAAREALQERAEARGLRLACDMVPNHMGIDSTWLVEHPEYFVSVPERPFPSYTFTGEDLSSDPRVSIYLEDHYADRSDAAVVFQRIDRESGEVSFVYHGNDGTSLPWNDTAQLDYTLAEVREAVIERILDLAQRFRVIRLDAAMTLVKEHFQRLWYPEAGKGGAVPSRAAFGLNREEFDRRMPRELWREVIERIEKEAPGTLLLAEGFWYMEGYFIRRLGMHRVYNSAFMHMLRDGENAKFRASLQNALEFDPAVLECFANFLTNPDERPAVDQLGKGDRYFALCALLVTLPGLPLFGHGQVEGLTEQYGMDFAAPHYSETPDPAFLARHAREIVPLLEDRSLYADGRRLRLFDVAPARPGGTRVLDDVFALINGPEDDRRLVVVHNRDADARGRIHTTVRFREAGQLRRETLAEVLGTEAKDRYCLFRERRGGRWHARATKDLVERGLEISLGPWEYRVYADFRSVRDTDGRYRRLAEIEEGVEDLESALAELAS